MESSLSALFGKMNEKNYFALFIIHLTQFTATLFIIVPFPVDTGISFDNKIVLPWRSLWASEPLSFLLFFNPFTHQVQKKRSSLESTLHLKNMLRVYSGVQQDMNSLIRITHRKSDTKREKKEFDILTLSNPREAVCNQVRPTSVPAGIQG